INSFRIIKFIVSAHVYTFSSFFWCYRILFTYAFLLSCSAEQTTDYKSAGAGEFQVNSSEF
ncbi:MAG TPA: hypothetical protein PK903_06450, partial [Paludibacteraceae bacterium]|nr:hypothetical protein [Paludibacteraceae bacterium]